MTKGIVPTSIVPEVERTLKPMYPKALSTTMGLAGRLTPWGGLLVLVGTDRQNLPCNRNQLGTSTVYGYIIL